MTTTELIELLKKHERGGATGRPREIMFDVNDRIIDTDGIEVTGSGDGLISELFLSLPSAEPEDYTELKQEFIRMAEYIDIFLKCPDEQKETLIGFVERIAEHLPWAKED